MSFGFRVQGLGGLRGLRGLGFRGSVGVEVPLCTVVTRGIVHRVLIGLLSAMKGFLNRASYLD